MRRWPLSHILCRSPLTQGLSKKFVQFRRKPMVIIGCHVESFVHRNTPSFFPSKTYEPDRSLTVPSFEEGVEFSSKFENANLDRAVRLSRTEYELYLSEDFNTSGHYHWFYFRTAATLPKGSEVWFAIVNMVKPTSLYSVGFRPFAYSVKGEQRWVPAGESVSYTANKPSIGSNDKRRYYSLRWKYVYEFDNDEVYFVQFVPYSYSDLLKYLKEIKNEKNGPILRIDMLCKTLARNACPMLTITENVKTYLSYHYEREMAAKSKSTKKIILAKVEKLCAKPIIRRNTEKNAGEAKHRMDTDALNFAEQDVRAHELEAALAEHKRDHGHKKGIIITARVHPGISSFPRCRRGSKFVGSQRSDGLPALRLSQRQTPAQTLHHPHNSHAEPRRRGLRQLPLLSPWLRPQPPVEISQSASAAHCLLRQGAGEGHG